jgi:diadenosine tetraphosphatase ApaH/serine/threonine PP2A family protein phosphatase
MRYAIFSDIHANLEALEAVLAKIDELAQEEPIDQLWFLGDLVGYGPNPNECIIKLRERTDIIIAGNHDWAAVGKIDLEDFSEAARISAEWTAEQLTEEHRQFLTNLPESFEIDECTLVHGSPYGPLWEYLTSEVLAERSFQYFRTRYCLVGHTHVPIIFQQPDSIANSPTIPLHVGTQNEIIASLEENTNHNTDDAENSAKLSADELASIHEDLADDLTDIGINIDEDFADEDDDEETVRVAAVRPSLQTTQAAKENSHAARAIVSVSAPDSTDNANDKTETPNNTADHLTDTPVTPVENTSDVVDDVKQVSEENTTGAVDNVEQVDTENTSDMVDDVEQASTEDEAEADAQTEDDNDSDASVSSDAALPQATTTDIIDEQPETSTADITNEEEIANAEEQFNQEIEELLALLGLSQSMVQVTNEMIVPPEGNWQAVEGYRAIINPGGVGQPRDGDPRAAFMIYDTEKGFTFYRVAYPFEKTQEKIIQAGLPPYLATRLAYGR